MCHFKMGGMRMRLLILKFYVFVCCACFETQEICKMVDLIAQRFLNDTCLVVFSNNGCAFKSVIPALYFDPYDTLLENENMDSETYKTTYLTEILEIGCNGFVIQTKNPARQFVLLEETFVLVNNRGNRKLIFLPLLEKSSFKNLDSHSIVETRSANYVPNLIMVEPSVTKNIFNLKTHYFGGTSNQSKEIIVLDTYNITSGKFLLDANLFPDKIKDLQGKILRAAVFHYMPYVVLTGNDTQNNSQIDGTEWRMALQFAKFHNCTFERFVSDEESWGTIFDNRTGNGVLGALVEDRADIGFVALYTWYHESLYLDLTTAYIRTGVTCLVPPPHRLPLWRSPILPFSPELWAGVVTTLIICNVVSFLLHYGANYIFFEDNKIVSAIAALEVAGIFLQQGLIKNRKELSWRTMAFSMLAVSVLLCTAYSSSLASAMTVPRYDAPINSAEDMANRDLKWAATHDAWIFSILQTDDPELKIVLKNFRIVKFNEIIKRSAEMEWGFSIERLSSEYLQQKYVEKMHLMASDIYWENCVFMLRKSSAYTTWFSLRILQVLASGIPARWEDQVVAEYLDYGTQKAVSKETFVDQGPMKMTVAQVQGTFFILFLGLLLALCVFVGEITLKRSVQI
ncbi:glutamate receptor ionotropic, delta-1 isoform X2 [Cephus cinctus]|uniref:Glutamate receptor ionotropic, delta-1 isoform X2 n=1 Tax=Cephus cinctus TaxID=211228 RepID=A0AAJ7FKJ7_CEPCN|nr:glutamate receptor ionotropic, delta-1 isoform X2 [Cephus cinctus]